MASTSCLWQSFAIPLSSKGVATPRYEYKLPFLSCGGSPQLKCMPEEIMEWIPDAEYNANTKKREELEAQIAELQAKLKNL